MTTALYIAGHLDARPVDAARRAALRPGLELGPGRRQRDHRDVAVQRGADFVRADAQRGCVQRHLAARRCGVRRLRQRQDGDQVQLRPLSRAGDQRHPLHAEQPGETNHDQRLAELAGWQPQLRGRLRHPESGGTGHSRWRHLRRAHGRRAELRQGGRQPGAGESGDPARVGHPAVRLAVGRGLPAGAGSARLVGRELQPALVREFHGHRQPGRRARRLRAVDDSGAGRLQASRGRRLPDHDLHADGRGGGARAAELRDVRNGFRGGAYQLLARRRPHRQGASRPRPDPPGRHEYRPLDHGHVRRPW